MVWQFNCRLLSLLLTLGLTLAVSEYGYWLAIVVGLGFTHYGLSFYYASARMRQLGGATDAALPLLGLTGLFAVVYFLDFPLEVYFGLHHAFNEAYLKRLNHTGQQQADQLIAPYRCLLHLAAYFCILRNDPHLAQIPQALLWTFGGLAVLVYALKAKQLLREKDSTATWSDHSIELALAAVVVLSLFFRITFLQIVLYHFVLWTLLPMPAMKQRGAGYLEQYLLLTVAALGLYFGALLVFAPTQFSVALAFVLSQFYLWSYLHITASLALSSAHPQWVVRLFAPAN